MKPGRIYLVALLTLACNSRTVRLCIDNPTEATISMYVDSLYVEVPPIEMVWVEMGKGRHAIRLADTSFAFEFKQDQYFVNPTHSAYLLSGEKLGSPGPDVPKYPSRKVNYMGYPLEGNYEVLGDVIMPVKWKYGPRQEIPAELYTDDDPRVVYKLYDINDFDNKLTVQYELKENKLPTGLFEPGDSVMIKDSIIEPEK